MELNTFDDQIFRNEDLALMGYSSRSVTLESSASDFQYVSADRQDSIEINIDDVQVDVNNALLPGKPQLASACNASIPRIPRAQLPVSSFPVSSSGHSSSIALTSHCQTHYSAAKTFPSNAAFAGKYNFKVECEKKTAGIKIRKSENYTYSENLRTLFVKQEILCPFRFYVSPGLPQSGCQIRAKMLFKDPINRREVVKRCPKHLNVVQDYSQGLCTARHNYMQDFFSTPLHHFVVCDSKDSVYCCCPYTKQLSVLTPFLPPFYNQTDYASGLYTFKCFTSCYKKGPLQIIFSLEVGGEVVGRQSLNVHVSASPGRDRKKQEQMFGGITPEAEVPSKRQKMSSDEFTLAVRGKQKFELLNLIKKALDAMETLDCIPGDIVEYYKSRQNNNSSPSPASCPLCTRPSCPPRPRNSKESATQTEPEFDGPFQVTKMRFTLRRTVSLNRFTKRTG